MNTNLTTIDNMIFAGAAIAAPPVSRPNPTNKAPHFNKTIDDTPPQTNTPESTTTDNTHAISQNEPVNKPPQDFRHTLRKAEATKPPQQDQGNTKPEKEDSASETDSNANAKANPTQLLSAPEIPITLGALVKEVATKAEPKDGRKLAQLIADLKDGKSTPVTSQAAKSAEIKSLLTADDKGQLGIKTILPEKSNGQTGLKTTLPETSKGQPGLQAVLSDTSESTTTADTQTVQGENTNKIPTSLLSSAPASGDASRGGGQESTEAIPTKAPTTTNSETVKEAMPNVIVDNDSKTATAGEKTVTVMAGTSVVADTPKTPPTVAGWGNNKLTPETPDSKTATTDEESATTDKPVIHVNEKTPVLNTSFTSVQTKSPEAQSQPVVIAPEKPVQIAEQTPDSNTAAPKTLSESPGNNGKGSQHTGNKLSDDSTAQELNVTDVQVSAGQTKDSGNSTSNNSFNSDLEQILSHNNPQAPATEQSSTSSEGIRTADVPGQNSTSDVSADISRQILDSIQSSLSQQRGNQQITVQLNPPELGKVLIKFQEQDGQIIGLLEVSKQQTRVEIQQALPQIIQNLQESGIQVKRVEVVLSDANQPEQETLKDQSLQNGLTQQQDSANSYQQTNNPYTDGINEWLLNSNSYQNISELQEALVTDGINMLA